MNYCDIKKVDVANGVGCRVSLFVSGCTFSCEDCFNKEAWNFEAGKHFSVKELMMMMEQLKKPYIHGVSVLGGEPLHPRNISDVLYVLAVLKAECPTKDVWLYTGYTYEQVQSIPEYAEIVGLVDVIVDGRFEVEKKQADLQFRGSTNQRIVDVKKSVAWGRIVEWKND